MTLLSKPSFQIEDVRHTINSYIRDLSDELYTLNQLIHDEPEKAFHEFKAQTCISDFLESQGHSVKRGAYNLPTSFESVHPMAEDQFYQNSTTETAGQSSIAIVDLIAEFRGTSARASANPWDGVNALDALVASYNNISMLRQQIKPDERIHGFILQAPKITNSIPEYTKVKFSIRRSKINALKKLSEHVRHCLEAGGLATGCEVEITEDLAYADLWVNDPLCSLFKVHMDSLGIPLSPGSKHDNISGSTDMGNVSHAIPGLHAIIGIETSPETFPHNHAFAEAAGTREAHLKILEAAKGKALMAWSTIFDDGIFTEIQRHFEKMGEKNSEDKPNL
ncbi:amidohydrolase [Fusarium beomiforme]|uniref:Amidohydrolase n=1 Tax=Fusarium beomiforme TaxID=44412 RepID=A0A9P5A8Y6_9HYPO|nr:amidohydrolase [Fusarium beomiforme]